MDGVLADMESELARYADALFREPANEAPAAVAGGPAPDAVPEPPEPAVVAGTSEQQPDPAPDSLPPAKLSLSSRQQRRLWRHVGTVENFWEGLEEIEPGIVQRLASVSTDRQWEIIFLTKRPQTAGASAQLQTQRWLQSKGFPWPSVFVVQGSRGQIAASLSLDLVIDDTPENCLDVVVDSKAKPFLVWRDDEHEPPVATRRLGIGVVRTVAECLDVLIEIDVPGRAPTGELEPASPPPASGDQPADAPPSR